MTATVGDIPLDVIRAYVEENFLISFDRETYGDTTDLFEAAVIDSYGMIDLISFLESRFGIEFSDDDLMSPDLTNVAGMVILVDNRRKETA